MRIRVPSVFGVPINHTFPYLGLDWKIIASAIPLNTDPLLAEYIIESVKTEITLTDLMPALKEGWKARRLGWNGKDQWVFYTRGRMLDLEKDDIWPKSIEDVAFKNNGKVKLRPYFSLKTQDDEVQIGWVPSVSDFLATDWELVE